MFCLPASRHLVSVSISRLGERSMAGGVGATAESIFQAGLRAVQPKQLISDKVKLEGENLLIEGSPFPLNHNVHIVGFGKASLGLVNHLGALVKDHVITGIVSCPDLPAPSDGTLQDLVNISPCLASRIAVFKGPTNNLPNETALEASKSIHELVKGLNERDILLTVITGGGSVLLTLPKPGLELENLTATTRLLANAGADIVDLNTVRKQLEVLKGGGLAKLAQPAKVISLILSDVIGDPLDIIAAGPTVENTTGPQDALNVLAKYNLIEKVSPQVLAILTESLEPTTAAPAENFIIGSNRVALSAAASEATRLGFAPVILTHSFSGRTEDVADQLSSLAATVLLDKTDAALAKCIGRLCADNPHHQKVLEEVVEALKECPTRLCFLAGGESTVEVPSNCGLGGRSAHLALKAADGLAPLADRPEHVTFLAGATDGLDGPTELAGAWVTSHTMARARQLGLDIAKHLNGCDAYGFFQKLDAGRHIRPGGLTGTNVMDIVVLTIEREP